MVSVRFYAIPPPLFFPMAGDNFRWNCVIADSLVVLDMLIDLLFNLSTCYCGQPARTRINDARYLSVQSF